MDSEREPRTAEEERVESITSSRLLPEKYLHKKKMKSILELRSSEKETLETQEKNECEY